jgi:hypothetical protein
MQTHEWPAGVHNILRPRFDVLVRVEKNTYLGASGAEASLRTHNTCQIGNQSTSFAATYESAGGTEHQFAAVQRFRQQCEDTADEEWTSFRRRWTHTQRRQEGDAEPCLFLPAHEEFCLGVIGQVLTFLTSS